MSEAAKFQVVIFSSGGPADIERLARRINTEVPEARVCGVLCERRPGKPLRKRLSAFVRKLGDKHFVRYAARRITDTLADRLAALGSAGIRFIHAAQPAKKASEDLDTVSRSLGCSVLITTDFHSEESLNFVRCLNPDLGIVYGTRILKPPLFTIPRLGSINIHKRRVPDYRGGGPVGLWEMLDGQTEIGVTVHEVVEKLDAGAVVHAETIPIQPFDSLTSLALKAHVVGNDLLVRSVADYARGTVQVRVQHGTSRMFKSPTPQQLAQFHKRLALERPAFRPLRGRPNMKLVLRTVAGMPMAAVRNWIRRIRGRFPVMILFHHIVTDRSHQLGMPTEHFLKQVQFLGKYYQIVSLSQAIEMLKTNSVKAPTVVLTFDDGYQDNFLTLRSIREQVDVPITLFVSTAHLTNQSGFAHDVNRGCDDFPPLTWDQLIQLRNEGVEIGSHTRNHFDCGSRDVSALRSEIIGSGQDLQKRTGNPVEFFSFPFGLLENISPQAMELAGKTYAYVFSAYGGSNFGSRHGNVKHLHRWPHPNDIWELELLLQSLLDFEPKEESASDASVPFSWCAEKGTDTPDTEFVRPPSSVSEP